MVKSMESNLRASIKSDRFLSSIRIDSYADSLSPTPTPYTFFKRLFDLVFAIIACLPAVFIIILISVAIILDDYGPIFSNQMRVGKNGKLFLLFKFRTMKTYNKENVHIQASKADSRFTRVGTFLRKTTLDELPQLFNILKGEMSFVGPRPLLPCEILNNGTSPIFLKDLPGYEKRHSVTPGLTGFAQIYAPRNLPQDQKFLCDLIYIKKRNFWLDLKLIFLSLLRTFKCRWEV